MAIYLYQIPRGYYVYYYLRSRDSLQSHGAKKGSPYYVGRGTRARAWNKLHGVHLPTDPNNIVIIADNLTLEQANQIEILHIAMWGRADIGTGILRNRTDGGGGSKGFKHTPEECLRIGERSRQRKHSPEARAKISHAAKIRTVSAETREKHRLASLGRKHTEETKAKLKLIRSGQVISDESRKKMSLAAKNRVRRPVSEETRAKLKMTAYNKKLKRLEAAALQLMPEATEDQIREYIAQALAPKVKKPRRPRGPMTERTKQKISLANKGRKPWTTGKTLPQEVRDKISKGNKGKPKKPRSRESIERGVSTRLANLATKRAV
jgi:hypothetical protein